MYMWHLYIYIYIHMYIQVLLHASILFVVHVIDIFIPQRWNWGGGPHPDFDLGPPLELSGFPEEGEDGTGDPLPAVNDDGGDLALDAWSECDLSGIFNCTCSGCTSYTCVVCLYCMEHHWDIKDIDMWFFCLKKVCIWYIGCAFRSQGEVQSPLGSMTDGERIQIELGPWEAFWIGIVHALARTFGNTVQYISYIIGGSLFCECKTSSNIRWLKDLPYHWISISLSVILWSQGTHPDYVLRSEYRNKCAWTYFLSIAWQNHSIDRLGTDLFPLSIASRGDESYKRGIVNKQRYSKVRVALTMADAHLKYTRVVSILPYCRSCWFRPWTVQTSFEILLIEFWQFLQRLHVYLY